MCETIFKGFFVTGFTITLIAGLVLIIVSLPSVWLEGSLQIGAVTVGSADVTLTKLKLNIEGGIVDSKSLKDYCDIPYGDFACKLSKASDALITLTSFGLAALVALWISLIINVCGENIKNYVLFKVFYVFVALAEFILFLVAFIVYSVVDNDAEDKGLRHETGWILYLIGMIINCAAGLGALVNFVSPGDYTPDECCCC